MASNNYTEEQKAAVLARIPEIGVKAAAEEAGIPWQAVARWNKGAQKVAEVASANVETEVAVEAPIAETVAEAPVVETEPEAVVETPAVEAKVEKKPAKAKAKPAEKKPAKAKAKLAEKKPAKAKAKPTAKKEVEAVTTDQKVKEKKNDSKAKFPRMMPFMTNRDWFKNNSKSRDEFKDSFKSYWEKTIEMEKSSVEAYRKQWTKSLDSLKDMQEKYIDSLPDDSKYPVSPRSFMKEMKKFQEMANKYFEDQMDSAVDFFFKGQEQLFDMVYKAMDKKAE